ncbi:MAG TPA: Rieske 2Fe-2S domain-containing protein [Polaromonas sp.]|uniref:Rieske (2Fe-2S) protein n=1 Tax=Polaromonas sp. TaxID=1869339 RepID=UPI002D7469B0|nr:Rieske 2Fe-2S domain-containing protein [Polaromonas sp.]HYW55979.1 Rieske 2Fe-2S domain-containing protein [Polaromonas sp.]
MSDLANGVVPLCRASELIEGGEAVPFDVIYAGQTCRAFAVRFEGQPHAYLNRCSHVAMELDWQPNRVFDASGQWLLCASHGAAYRPDTGECAGGPCQGGLVKITLTERDGLVFWHSSYNLKTIEF